MFLYFLGKYLGKLLYIFRRLYYIFYDNVLFLSIHHQLCKTGGSSQQAVSIPLTTGNEHESLML